MVAGEYLPREIESLADDGRLVFIALLGGRQGAAGFKCGFAPSAVGYRLTCARARSSSKAAIASGCAKWSGRCSTRERVKPMLFSHVSAGAGR